MAADCLILLIIGILASASDSSGAKWGQAALCLMWLFIYSSTIGPICYTIISETSSLKLRAKSVCLSGNIYNITQIIANIIEPYLINPTEANLKGETAYFWFATAFCALIWAFFRLPEVCFTYYNQTCSRLMHCLQCRNRTYEELDVMFHQRVPARKFATYDVDAYDNELTGKE